jgi:hypothetical protein
VPGDKRRRRHRGEGEATESKDKDATLDLLFKHPNAILAAYILRQMKYMKHVSETLAKTSEKHLKTITKHTHIQIKHLQHMCETYATYK